MYASFPVYRGRIHLLDLLPFTLSYCDVITIGFSVSLHISHLMQITYATEKLRIELGGALDDTASAPRKSLCCVSSPGGHLGI